MMPEHGHDGSPPAGRPFRVRLPLILDSLIKSCLCDPQRAQM